MKVILALVFSVLVNNLNAQIQFEQVLPLPPVPQITSDLEGVENSSIAFSDINGDNVEDVLITGYNNLNQSIAKLYTNDGSGNFVEILGTPFDGVQYGSIAFSDVDGDNDQDVLITGRNNSNQVIAKLYTNDGSGSFTEVMGTPFDGVSNSSIVFSDVDGDTDQDVLITGYNSLNQHIAKLYTNDGSGSFTEVMGTPFEGVSNSSIAFSDVDGDTDQDVLITGYNNSSQHIAKLYTNDGSGSFTEVMGTPFEGVLYSSIAFSDVDGDTDKDVLITGLNASSQQIAKLYTNDGSGNFTEVTGTPFDGMQSGSIAFSDVDGDADEDVLITGYSLSGFISKLYTNDGSGTFTEVMGTLFDGVINGSIAFSDVDGDTDQDVLITGLNNSSVKIIKSFTNDGLGNFIELTLSPFNGVVSSSIAFSDVDGDNDEDVLITGANNSYQFISKLYTNNGLGGFTEVLGTPFDGVVNGSIAFSDVDGDNDQDVLITGYSSSTQFIAKLYTNDGSGSFTEVTGTPFEGVRNSSIAFSDVDGDNDQDVLITGRNNSNQKISKLYTNNGSGSFTEVTGTTFIGVENGSITFSDVDGDTDQDVLITGLNSSNQKIAKLYTNNGSGSFTEVTGTPFVGVWSSSIAFSDVDGDTDQDVLITGYNSYPSITKLYTNDGSGSFTEVTGTPFEGVSSGSIAFSDVDGDNDQDVLITGGNSFGQRIAKLYTNNGSGSFTEVTGMPFVGVNSGSIAFSDVDGDNDKDVLITGANNLNYRITKLYRNTTCILNTRDTAAVACNSFDWHGITYTSSGTPTHTIINVIGCDSLVTLNLTITNSNTGDTSAVACDSFDWYGTTYITSGVPTHTLTNSAGCDSIVTLNLTITNNSNTGDTTVVACYSFDWYGMTYSSSATPTHTLTNMVGCDSVVTLNLTINNSNTGDTTAVACGSFDWYGTIYNNSATPTHTLTNSVGCDSVVTLNLTINNSNTTDITVVACGSFDWYGTTYTSSASPIQTLINSTGCDSVVTLNLTINTSNTGDTTAVGCGSFDWYGTTYTSSGTATHTLTNSAGCDSIVTLNLTMNSSNTGDTTAVVCDSFDWYGTTYTSSIPVTVTLTHTLTNSGGCDSLVTLYLTIKKSNSGDTTAVACDSFDWYGVTYTTSGTPTHILPNSASCDSVVTLNLTINTIDNSVTQTNGVNLMANTMGAIYQWIDCEDDNLPIVGETNQSFIATDNGDYAVIITENGCSDTSDCVIIDNVGIVEVTNNLDVSIYPNPATEQISITLSELSNQGYQLTIFNSLGAEVYEQSLNSKTTVVRTSKLNTGVYFVKITNSKYTAIKRLVIE